MKRILPLLLIAALLPACLAGCGQSTGVGDLSRTSYIEVRAFSMTDQGYTDYVITDSQLVDKVCAAFADLTLEKVRNTEPLMIAYTLQFYNHSHVPVDSITVIAGGTVVDYDGALYVADADMQAYMDGIVAQLTPARPDGT